jgi:hypothetical protein
LWEADIFFWASETSFCQYSYCRLQSTRKSFSWSFSVSFSSTNRRRFATTVGSWRRADDERGNDEELANLFVFLGLEVGELCAETSELGL